MWNVLIAFAKYVGFVLIVLSLTTQAPAQQTSPIKEGAYTALVAVPENGPLVDAVLEAWLDGAGFEALRTHLSTRSERADLTATEHAALGFLWRRLYQPVTALDHWKKATELEPEQIALWRERAGQELRLNRLPEAVASFGKIVLSDDPQQVRLLVRSLAHVFRQSGDQTAQQLLHQWMTSRPDDVELWLELADLQGRFSGSEKQWLERLAGWRETVEDPALLTKIRLLECDELNNQGKRQDAFGTLIAALGEVTVDSKEEASLLPSLVNLLRQSANVNPPLKANLGAFARTQMERPAVVMALAREFNEQGEISQALDLLKALAEALPADPRIPAARLWIMEENGLRDEALTLLRAGPDKIALALALKDEGRAAEALEALSDLPESPLAQALRGLIEGKEPAFPVEPEPPTPGAPVAAPATQRVEISGVQFDERLRELFERWQAAPSDLGHASALLHGWAATGKRAEADHLFKQTLKQMESVEEKIAWVKELQHPERGHPMRFDFRRALLTAGEVQQDNAEFWLLMADAVRNQGFDVRAETLSQAADRLSGEQALAVWLQAAEMAFESHRFPQGMAMANELLGSSQDAVARLLLARVDLREGRIDQARRTAWALAEHPAMTPTHALGIAADLIRWGETAESAAFVALQRQRFPQESALRMFQLKSALQAGLTEASIELLLKIGSTPIPSVSGLQHFAVEWGALQSAVASTYLLDRDWLEMFVNVGRLGRDEVFWMERGLATANGPFAMAHLLRYAQREGLDLDARRALAARAESAGLPLPHSLIWARMDETEHGQATLVPDLNQVEKLPVEQWGDAVAFHYQQRLMAPRPNTAVLTEQDHRILKKLTASLLAKQPEQALQLSFRWWQQQPAGADSENALRTVLASLEPSFDRLPILLQSLLTGLSPEQKKHPLMKEVTAALLGWLDDQKEDSEPYGMRIFWVASCFFKLDQWQQAADLAERGWLLPGGPGAPAIPEVHPGSQPPRWIHWNIQSPLVWPPNLGLSRLSAIPIFLTSQPQYSPDTLIVPQEQRTAFLAAGAKLTHFPLRLLWLLAGGDEEGAKSLIKEWQKGTPDSIVATQLAATVAASEGKLDDALDLLHRLITADADKNDVRRQQQVDYLRAALTPPATVDPFTAVAQRPPPAPHRERVQQILRELQPELEAWPAYAVNWLPVFKAAGMEQATAEWKQLNQVSPQTEESSNWTILATRSNSRLQRQIETPFTPRRVGSHQVTHLLETGFRPQAVALLLKALKAEADQNFLRPGSAHSEWLDLLQRRTDLREGVLNAASALRRQRTRELNQAIHLAAACEAWQQLVEWASEAQAIVNANPHLKSRVDLARLEMGVGVAELVKELSTPSTRDQTERFKGLMSALQNPRSFERQLQLAELFVALAEQSPPLPLFIANEASGLVSTVLQSLSRSYSLPNNAGVIPPLYPELDPNPTGRTNQTPPDNFTEADLEKRRDLHGRLCDLAFANPRWFQIALPHIVQRHLVENQPTLDALVERISQGRNDLQRSGYFNVDQLARLGHSWRDVSLRLRLADLLKRVLATPVELPPAARPPQRQRPEPIDSLITLIAGEVKGEADPPLWSMWEFPFHREDGNKPHTPEQITWNKQRHQIFEEFTKWALEQDDYRAAIFPLWAVHRLFFEGTEESVLTQAQRLKEQPGDPFALKAFVKATLLAYPNTHNLRCAGLILRLIDELSEGEVDSAITQPIINLLVNGHNRKSLLLPSIDLPPDKVNLKQHDLTPEQQQRRVELVDLFSAKLPLSAQPPNLLLSRLFREMNENADTQAIEEALSEIGRTDPSLVNAAIGNRVERMDFSFGVTNGTRIKSAFLRIAEGYVDQAAAAQKAPQFLWHIMRPHAASPTHSVDPFPPPSGRFTKVDPYVEKPATWTSTDPEVLNQRRENFLGALAICAREPAMHRSSLSDRLAEHLLNREKWPDLFEEMKGYYVANDSGCSDDLRSWLGMETAYFDMERVPSITKFLIQWLAALKTIEGPKQHAWLSTMRSCYTRDPHGHNKEDGRDPRERVVLAPLNWPLSISSRLTYPANPELESTVASLKESWLSLLAQCAEVPSALRVVFPDLIAAHLESNPARLATLAMQLTKEDFVTYLEPLFKIHTYTHREQPLSFRLALVDFFLQLPGAVDGNFNPGEPPAALTLSPETLIKYLKMQRSSNRPPPPPPLIQAEWGDPVLATRGQNLLTTLEQLLAKDPKKLAADRVAILLQAVAERSPSRAEIDQVLAEAKAQPEGVLRALNDHVGKPTAPLSQLTPEQLAGNLTQGELMVAVAADWPTEMDIPLREWWIALTHYLGRSQTTDSENHAKISQLQERMMTAAMEKGNLGPGLFGVYAAVSNNTPEGLAGLTDRVHKLIQQSPIEANRLLSTWSSSYSASSEQPLDTLLPTLALGRDLVRDWPVEAGPETLNWVIGVIDMANKADIALIQSRWMQHEILSVSPYPASHPLCQTLVEEMLTLLLERKAGAPQWVGPARLRSSARQPLTLEELGAIIRPLFKEPWLTHTLSYFNKVLEKQHHYLMMHANMYRNRTNFIVEPLEELRDLLRCLAAAAQAKLLTETEVTRLASEVKTAEARLDRSLFDLKRQQIDIKSLADNFQELASARFQGEEAERLTPADVPASILSSLINKQPVTEVLDRIWDIVQADPEQGTAALEKWADTIGKEYPFHAYCESGKLANALIARWHANLPPPDWAVVFLHRWNSYGWAGSPRDGPIIRLESSRFMPISAEIRPQIQARLKKFPNCLADAYFPTVAATSRDPLENPDLELVGLAITHLQTHLAAKRNPSILPESPPANTIRPSGERTSSLTTPLSAPSAIWFLLEHTARHGKVQAIEDLWTSSDLTAFTKTNEVLASLQDLFLGSADSFVTTASQFHAAASKIEHKNDPFVWILRIALLRDTRLTWADWRAMAPPNLTTENAAHRGVQLRHWLLYLAENGQLNIIDQLVSYCREMTKDSPFQTAREAPINTSPNEIFLGNLRLPQNPFKSEEWNRAWESLVIAAQVADTWPSAVIAAEQLGLLESTRHYDYFAAARSVSFWTARNSNEWFAYLEPTDLANDGADIQWFWVKENGRSAWLWRLPHFLASKDKSEALEELDRRQQRSPTLGRALLRLAVLHSLTTITADQLTQELSPVMAELERQPEQIRLAISGTLHTAAPRLPEAITAAPPDSVLQRLALPDQAKAVSAEITFWLADDEPLSDPPPASFDSWTSKLANDLRLLILKDDPRSHDVLVRGLAKLTKRSEQAATAQLDFSTLTTLILGSVAMRDTVSQADPTPDKTREGYRNIIRTAGFLAAHWPDNATESPEHLKSLEQTANLRSASFNLPQLHQLDGRAIAHELLYLPNPHRPETALVFLDPFRDLVLRLPVGATAALLDTLREFAGEDPARQSLLWALEHTVATLGGPAATPVPWPPHFVQRWQDPNCPPLVRYWLASVVPDTEAKANPQALFEAAAHCCRNKSFPSMVDRLAKIDLRPILDTDLSPGAELALSEFITSFCGLIAGLNQDVPYSSTTDRVLAVYDRLFQPILLRLKKKDELTRRSELLDHLAKAGLMPLSLVKQELEEGLDPARLYLQAPIAPRTMSLQPRASTLVSLTAQSAAKLQGVITPSSPLPLRTLQFLLLLGPDAPSEPPPQTRAQRIAEWEPLFAADPTLRTDALRNLTLLHWYSDDLLPLLEKDSAVRTFSAETNHLSHPTEAFSRDRQLLTYHALLHWRVKRDPATWLRVLERDALLPSLYEVTRASDASLCGYLADTITTFAPSEWVKEVPLLIATLESPFAKALNPATCYAFATLAGAFSNDPAVSRLAELIATANPTFTQDRNPLATKRLWTAIADHPDLPPVLRLRCVLPPWRTSSTTPLLLERLIAMHSLGLLDPVGLAEQVDAIDAKAIALPIYPLVRWLYHCNQTDAAHRLIAKVLMEVPASDLDDPLEWALVAELCHHTGKPDLTKAAIERASPPETLLQPTPKLIIDRLKYQ